MSDNLKMVLIILIGAAVLVTLGLAIGPRLKLVNFNIFKFFSGKLKGADRGPSVKDAEAWGENNKITATGVGASVDNARTVGKGNEIGANTVPPPVNPKTKRKS